MQEYNKIIQYKIYVYGPPNIFTDLLYEMLLVTTRNRRAVSVADWLVTFQAVFIFNKPQI